MFQFTLTSAALRMSAPQKDNRSSAQLLRVAQRLCIALGLLVLSSTALAQVQPALPGSIEYGLLTNNFTWVRTSAPITVGSYVEDLLSDSRWNQPAGRGDIGIVTATSWDPDYNTMAAMVDFGRNYSVGIVFPELSTVQLVAVPEPSSLGILLFAGLLIPAVRRRPGHANAA